MSLAKLSSLASFRKYASAFFYRHDEARFGRNQGFKVFDSLQVHGPTSLYWVKADTLHVSGPLTFSRLSVGEDAVVEGSMQGDHGKFGSLEVAGEVKFEEVICGKLIVRGSCEARDLMVNGDAKFFGPLQLNHGELQEVMALGEEVILDNVTAGTIHLERHEGSQILILKGSTLIRGDIQLAHPDSKVQTEGDQVKILGQTHIKKSLNLQQKNDS